MLYLMHPEILYLLLLQHLFQLVVIHYILIFLEPILFLKFLEFRFVILEYLSVLGVGRKVDGFIGVGTDVK